MEALDGRKTYIVAVVMAVFNALLAFHVFTLSPEQTISINGILAALGGAALRAGVEKN